MVPNSNIFLWTAVSVADAAGVNANGVQTLLTNGLSTFPIKGNPVFSDDPKSLPTNLAGCSILCNWVFHDIILAEEWFAKALKALKLVY